MATEPHPDAQAFLDERSDAPPMEELAIEDLRGGPLPEGEPEPVDEVVDIVVRANGHGIPVRLTKPAGDGPFPIFVWAHGGGSILGTIETEDPTARALANTTGCIVASVEYRLAPEHPFPAAFRDFHAVVNWAAESADEYGADPDTIVTGGESAGGKLAASCAHYIRDHGGPDIDYQVLVYPSVNYSREFPSQEEYDGYILTTENIAWFNEQYLEEPIHGYNPYAYALEDDYFGDLPPATVLTAGFDPLQDACKAYVDELRDAGVEVSHHHYPDMIHTFFGQLQSPEWERAREAVRDVGDDVVASLD